MRPGASPFQNGIVGGAPWAFSTRTMPADSMRLMRQEVVPSRTMSPAIDSTEKSSSSVPTNVPSGSAIDAVVGDLGDRAAALDGGACARRGGPGACR